MSQYFSKAILSDIYQLLAQVLLFYSISHTTNSYITIIKLLVYKYLINSYKILLLRLTINSKLLNGGQANKNTQTMIGIGFNL